MMLVYGEYDWYEKKGGKWALVKRQTCRWEWMSVMKIKRSIRKCKPKNKDPKDGEYEEWRQLTKEEFEIRKLALADALDTGAPMYDKVVADYKKQKAEADEEEATILAQQISKQKKDEKQAARNEILQNNLKAKDKELATLKEQLKGKYTHDPSQVAQVAQLKTDLEAEKAKNVKLSEDIKGFEEIKAKYHKFPAELRVLPEDELLKKLSSAQDAKMDLTLLKAKVLSYFEALLAQKKEGDKSYKGNLKDVMPRSMQTFFDNSELV